MANRINRAVELLAQDQPIYYVGGHTGHVLTYEQGKKDSHTSFYWNTTQNKAFITESLQEVLC